MLSHVAGMERNDAIPKNSEQANHIAASVTAIHPLVPGDWLIRQRQGELVESAL